MPRNLYFSQGTTAEQRLYEDLIIESLKIYGFDCYYIPRTIVNEHAIFNEAELSEFGDAYMIEAYIETVDGFGGDGDLLTKFGVEIRDQMTLIVSDKRWRELIGRFQLDSPGIAYDSESRPRPKEGDLIYFPLVKGLFEITFVEDENPFYQLQGLPTFKFNCELFDYSGEQLDTGITVIDEIERKYGQRTRLTIGDIVGLGFTADTTNYTADITTVTADSTLLSGGGGTGNYIIGEDVTQKLSDSPQTIITGEVANIGSGYIDVVSIVSSDDSPERSTDLFTITSGGVGNLVGVESGAIYGITAVDSFNPIDDIDQTIQNVDFETEGNSFIDFSETNPFGLVNVTT